jgi:hypothetical protein
MTRRGVTGVLSRAVALATLSGCGLFNTKASYRFRMTVEVATPQGLRTGSSVVYEVVAEQNNTRRLADERAGGTITRGEAVVVDLPSGPLFVLNKGASETLGGVVTYVLAPGASRNDIGAYVAAVRQLARASNGEVKAELPRAEWPMMVRFRDINDPKSVEQVAPAEIGARRIMVETTRDPITTEIERRLSWLAALKGRYLDGQSIGTAQNNGLNGGHFSTEIG